MDWWVWVLIGLALAGFEMVTPGGFFVMFFGVGALLVGILVGVGAGGPPWFQWLLFSVFSIVLLLLLRARLVKMTRSRAPDHPVDSVQGEVATPLEDLAPGAVGKAELRGTAWNAHNGDSQPLTKGQRCRVTRVDGITLWIRAE